MTSSRNETAKCNTLLTEYECIEWVVHRDIDWLYTEPKF